MINNSNVKQLSKNIENKILCTYKNVSSSWQIIKITNFPNFVWEKTVFPGQEIVFEASLQAKLKVFSADNITAVLTDTISCQKLVNN